MEKLILVPRFVDRSGRTVYDIHQDDPKKRVCSPGEFVGQIRMNVADGNCVPTIELVQDPELSLHLGDSESILGRDGTG